MSETPEDCDEERPALTRKIPLKKEFAMVSAAIMDKLREALLLNPHWCELTATQSRRSEQFGDLDLIALANVRTRKLRRRRNSATAKRRTADHSRMG